MGHIDKTYLLAVGLIVAGLMLALTGIGASSWIVGAILIIVLGREKREDRSAMRLATEALVYQAERLRKLLEDNKRDAAA
jgi:hypothetical protein